MNSEQIAVCEKIAKLAPKRKKVKAAQPTHGDSDTSNNTNKQPADKKETPDPKDETKDDEDFSRFLYKSLIKEHPDFYSNLQSKKQKYKEAKEKFEDFKPTDSSAMSTYRHDMLKKDMQREYKSYHSYKEFLHEQVERKKRYEIYRKRYEEYKREKATDKTKPTPPSNDAPAPSNDAPTEKPTEKKIKQYTEDDYKKKLEQLEEKHFTNFVGSHLRKTTFLKVFNELAHDKSRRAEFQEIMGMLDKATLNKAVLNPVGDRLKQLMLPFKERLKIAERDLFDFKEHELKNFKRGDKLPSDAGDRVEEILSMFTTAETESDSAAAQKIKTLLDSVFKEFGVRYSLYLRGGKGKFKYDEDTKEAEMRRDGKEDQEIGNSAEFFTYDMHDVIKIIEKGLHVKLSDAAKTNIEAIMEKETRDMRYKSNLNHGYNDINSVISKIERYINKRKKIDGHVFKFSEASRFTLKEILKTEKIKQMNNKATPLGFVKTESHGMNSKELMFRLQNMIL